MTASYSLYGALTSERLLEQADYYRLVVPHQSPSFDSTLPFFYRDSAREYFVVPTDYYQNGNYFTINAPEYVYDPFFKAEYTVLAVLPPWTSLLVTQLNSGRRNRRALRAGGAAQPRVGRRRHSVRLPHVLRADRLRAQAVPGRGDGLRSSGLVLGRLLDLQRSVRALQLGAVLPRAVPDRELALARTSSSSPPSTGTSTSSTRPATALRRTRRPGSRSATGSPSRSTR